MEVKVNHKKSLKKYFDDEISECSRPWVGIVLCLISALLSEFCLGLSSGKIIWITAIARVSIIFLCLYTIHRFSLASFRKYRPNTRDFFYLHSILIFNVTLIAFGNFFGEAIANYSEVLAHVNVFQASSAHYAIPFAFGAFIIQAVLGVHHCLIFSLSLTIILSAYIPNEYLLILGCLLSCLVACLSLRKFRTRSTYIKAGLNVAFIMFPFALASIVIQGDCSLADISVRLLGTLVSGVLCAFIAAGVTPIVEHLGGYVTDMRLIEMATLDHPLLKELSIQAAGTWNHSMVMGMMVEAASDQIGANAILARVGAYFHDIGKMNKPLYFVENQSGIENRHDKLSPSMSALIIRSHVKDGIEMARQHKLPEAIIDMIPQHHGTSVIEYFYDKACKEMKESSQDSEVDKSLYTYPGPRPQTKEAGLLMLADGIEAAARTLSEPTVDRIQGLVQKMINKVFASGELNECELTLNDLHKIAKCFTRVLCGIYHQRIAYAEPAEKQHEKASVQEEANKEPVAEDRTQHPKQKEAEERKSKESKQEDLKRLGL